MGCNFDTSNDGIDSFQGVEEIIDDFAFDGSKVNFYQIMGKDAVKMAKDRIQEVNDPKKSNSPNVFSPDDKTGAAKGTVNPQSTRNDNKKSSNN